MADRRTLSASDLFPERRLAPAADLAALRGDAELRAIEGNWPKIRFHALREHARTVASAF